MIKAISQAFGIVPIEIKKLNGYENENYLITAKDARFIFKSYPNNKKTKALLEAECGALLHLQKEGPLSTPIPVAFSCGSFVKTLHIEKKTKLCRMLTFLPGNFLGDAPATHVLMESLGAFLAELNKKLSDFHSYALEARNYAWDLQNLHLNKKHIKHISSPEKRRLVLYFFQQFETHVSPLIPSLRKSFIHSDFNEWNVLIEGNRVVGLIDFGDMVYSPVINEVATALTYLTYDKETFFEWATPFLKAYHNIIPLKETEVELLYYLIATKLCISVCQSSNAKRQQPENKYASVSEKNAWRSLERLIKMNPLGVENHFLKALGFEVKEQNSVAHQIQKRQKYFSPLLSVSYKNPVFMKRAALQYMYDGYGNTFLDAYNNIPHVGHSHPRVVSAGQKQMATLNTNTRYLYDLLPSYAEKLLQKLPKTLSKIFFVNSGSEANDLAIRMAKKHSGNKSMMVLEHGYHGHTQAGIDISDYKFSNLKGEGQKNHIIKAEIPNEYDSQKPIKTGLSSAEKAIKQIKNSTDSIAAFIAEPIVGCGGQVPLAPGYLKTIYPEIRKQGGVCISDEVQTGFGRLGSWFWGFEMHEVVPDIVVLGKPMGNGHPIGAVVTTAEIAHSFEQGVEFFSSFGGNPVSCAIGMAVLQTIEEEGLQENAEEVGAYYKSLLKSVQEQDARIGDVRGEGLFLGIEIISYDGTPNRKLAQEIKDQLRTKNILISTDGPFDSVLKTKPPLVFTKENAEEVVEAIHSVLLSKA
ncbi:MAG: aminotransferase class III-fold pyridoxal phosphate-dependent enzyme [Crocinitomicaceae bacterium]|nr:aminotransferase class III-fold pyridoxal phosphate-dependent enzyme [Crocinitomicaceae bacterium]